MMCFGGDGGACLSGFEEDRKLEQEASKELIKTLARIYHPWTMELEDINPDMYD